MAAFGESLHIQGNRVVPPGGDEAAALWESVVGEKLNRPERFVQILFESERGRVAYLYDAFAHLDPPTLAFALESSIREPEERANRFKRLAALARHGFVEWEVAAAPFVRPSSALATFFARLAIDERGNPIGWMSPAFWQRVFDEGAGSPPQSGGAASIDAAWVAELLLGRPGRERERRVETFVFAQRVFPSAAETDDTLVGCAQLLDVPRVDAHDRADGHPDTGDLRGRRAAGGTIDRSGHVTRGAGACPVSGRRRSSLEARTGPHHRRRDGGAARARSVRIALDRRALQRRHLDLDGRAASPGAAGRVNAGLNARLNR